MVLEQVARAGDDPHHTAHLGRVEYACRIGEGYLLAGWCAGASGSRRTRPIATHQLRATELGPLEDLDGYVRFLAVLDGELPLEPELFGVQKGAVELDGADDSSAISDPQTFAWTALGGLDGQTRKHALEFIASLTAVGRGRPRRYAVAEQLRALHDALRERHAPVVIAPENPRGLYVDTILAVDDKAFYVRGWVHSADGPVTSLVITAPEGVGVELAEAVFRFARPDIGQFYGADADAQRRDRPGFIAYFELAAPSCLRDGWTSALTDATGATVETTLPAVVDDPMTVRATILGDLAYDPMPNDTLLREHAFPAISRLQERCARAAKTSCVRQFGDAPSDPDVTIIVPLYRRIDFLEHQLAQFVHDPDIARADLVYVLDSPELGDAAAEYALQLHRLYRIPFRLALMDCNSGFAGANNAGAELARGRLLLLMNSDVLPDRPGWLGRLVEFYDSTPGIGALGPKLVYEDGSIQHAGLYFLRSAGVPWWENAHHHKGLHRSFPAANVVRSVAAVTGGCLMVSLAVWRRVGGLQGMYVQGDYEDSDLCLRLAEFGYVHWYLPDVELYHLEGQSYPTELRRLTARYNGWLHTHLWGPQIDALTAELSPAAPSTAEVPSAAPASAKPRRARARRSSTRKE